MARVSKKYFETKTDRSKFYRFLSILSKKFTYEENIFCVQDDKFIFTDGSFYVTMKDTKLNIKSKSDDILTLNNTLEFKTELENKTNLDNIQEFIDKQSYGDYNLSQKVKKVQEELLDNFPDKEEAYFMLFMDTNTLEDLVEFIEASDKFISSYSTFIFEGSSNKINLESIYSKSEVELSNVKIDYLKEIKDNIKLSLPMPIYNILDKITCLDCAIYRFNNKSDLVDLNVDLDNITVNIRYRIMRNKSIKDV